MQIFDGFIAAIASELKIKFHKTEEGHYSTKIEFENNRNQDVMISLGKDESGDRVIHYYSAIAGLKSDSAELYKYALLLNASLEYGAIALVDKSLISRGSMLLKNCEPERFIKSLFYIAAKADEIEEELTGKDIN